jgi:acetyltransferase
VVADDSQHLGIGSKLMRTLMQSAKEKGMLFFEAEMLSSNEPARAMLHKLGFNFETITGNDELVRAIKDLRQ